MKIIGHRGAAGLAVENTKYSITSALEAGVYAVEVDIRKTSDGVLVLNHDSSLQRIHGAAHHISHITYAELKRITTRVGIDLLLLEEALELVGDTPIIIEIKQTGSAEILASILKRYPKKHVSVSSFYHSELRKIKTLTPGVQLLALEHLNPFEVVERARAYRFDGIGLNFWLLNPLTYLLARRAKLSIYVYTVNSILLARFLNALYPRIAICTDRPDRLLNKNK